MRRTKVLSSAGGLPWSLLAAQSFAKFRATLTGEADTDDVMIAAIAVSNDFTLVTRRPLVEGNLVMPLVNGDAAYPAMLDAIEHARSSITMATYIFDHDRSGIQFVEALGRAVQRGIEVRVLVDALGARYSKPSILGALRAAGVRSHRFMPTSAPWRAKYMNLRNHRKVLIVDGAIGFTGGMNVREGHVLSLGSPAPVQDIHFRIEGPVV